MNPFSFIIDKFHEHISKESAKSVVHEYGFGEIFFASYRRYPKATEDSLEELKIRDKYLYDEIISYIREEEEKLKGTKFEVKR